MPTGTGADDGMQLGTTGPGARKHFPKRQNTPLEVVSERRIDDAIITQTQGEPRKGKQTSLEEHVTGSISSLSPEKRHQTRWTSEDRTTQFHREWWKTFDQTTESTRRRQRSRGRSNS